MLAAFGVQLGMEAKTDEGVGMRARDDEDGAAVASIAAARSAARDEFFAPEREASSSAVPGCDLNVDFVDENCATPAAGR